MRMYDVMVRFVIFVKQLTQSSKFCCCCCGVLSNDDDDDVRLELEHRAKVEVLATARVEVRAWITIMVKEGQGSAFWLWFELWRGLGCNKMI